MSEGSGAGVDEPESRVDLRNYASLAPGNALSMIVRVESSFADQEFDFAGEEQVAVRHIGTADHTSRYELASEHLVLVLEVGPELLQFRFGDSWFVLMPAPLDAELSPGSTSTSRGSFSHSTAITEEDECVQSALSLARDESTEPSNADVTAVELRTTWCRGLGLQSLQWATEYAHGERTVSWETIP